jgi:hypothetical protein
MVEAASQPKPPYSQAYLRGIELFNRGDYYECHEVLEDLWIVSCGQEKLFYQGIIMAAVAFYHYQLGRFGAARVMYHKAKERLQQVSNVFMSLDVRAFTAQLDHYFNYTVEDAPSGARAAMKPPQIQLQD